MYSAHADGGGCGSHHEVVVFSEEEEKQICSWVVHFFLTEQLIFKHWLIYFEIEWNTFNSLLLLILSLQLCESCNNQNCTRLHQCLLISD